MPYRAIKILEAQSKEEITKLCNDFINSREGKEARIISIDYIVEQNKYIILIEY